MGDFRFIPKYIPVIPVISKVYEKHIENWHSAAKIRFFFSIISAGMEKIFFRNRKKRNSGFSEMAKYSSISEIHSIIFQYGKYSSISEKYKKLIFAWDFKQKLDWQYMDIII
jgi:hypothetical protein